MISSSSICCGPISQMPAEITSKLKASGSRHDCSNLMIQLPQSFSPEPRCEGSPSEAHYCRLFTPTPTLPNQFPSVRISGTPPPLQFIHAPPSTPILQCREMIQTPISQYSPFSMIPFGLPQPFNVMNASPHFIIPPHMVVQTDFDMANGASMPIIMNMTECGNHYGDVKDALPLDFYSGFDALTTNGISQKCSVGMGIPLPVSALIGDYTDGKGQIGSTSNSLPGSALAGEGTDQQCDISNESRHSDDGVEKEILKDNETCACEEYNVDADDGDPLLVNDDENDVDSVEKSENRRGGFQFQNISAQNGNNGTNLSMFGNCSISKKHTNPHYKTRLCNNFLNGVMCPYGGKCRFAHGKPELRRLRTFKIDRCRNDVNGYCRYGQSCRYVHNSKIVNDNQVSRDSNSTSSVQAHHVSNSQRSVPTRHQPPQQVAPGSKSDQTVFHGSTQQHNSAMTTYPTQQYTMVSQQQASTFINNTPHHHQQRQQLNPSPVMMTNHILNHMQSDPIDSNSLVNYEVCSNGWGGPATFASVGQQYQQSNGVFANNLDQLRADLPINSQLFAPIESVISSPVSTPTVHTSSHHPVSSSKSSPLSKTNHTPSMNGNSFAMKNTSFCVPNSISPTERLRSQSIHSKDVISVTQHNGEISPKEKPQQLSFSKAVERGLQPRSSVKITSEEVRSSDI